MANFDLVKGRSQALNKTISEIMTFLGDKGYRPGGRGSDLRGFLREKLADLAENWYKRGVRRGHMESHKAAATKGTVPKKLHYKGHREFFDGEKRSVRVVSRIKRRK